MGNDRRQKLLLIAAIICIGALAGDHFVVTPLANLWKARSSRITELQSNLAKGVLLVDRDEDLRSRWDGDDAPQLAGGSPRRLKAKCWPLSANGPAKAM